jgi:hypothetical protein
MTHRLVLGTGAIGAMALSTALLDAGGAEACQTSANRVVVVFESTSATTRGDSMTEGEKFQVDPSDDPNPDVPDHALPDDAKGPHPLADPANDPTPGVPGHAKDD